MIFDAVILAGGRSSRLGGHPKSELVFEGATLLQRTLDAVQDARQIVIVGDPGAARVSPATIVTREDPPFGGPAAAIAAALDATTGVAAEWVVVLACDMPFASRAVPALLSNALLSNAAVDAVGDAVGDGVVAVDEDGREQYLLACYRRAALRDVLDLHRGSVAGMPVRALISSLRTTPVAVPAESSTDIDTWADAALLDICPEPGVRHD